VFTNLSQDHLNFHPDMHSYLRAKGRLFEELASGGKDAVAVVNEDDPVAGYIKQVNRGRLITYGLATRADVRAEAVYTGRDGSRFRARTPHGAIEVRLAHLGDYSVHNALAAVACGVALGLPSGHIRDGVAGAPQVPGRFELIDEGQDFLVIVDYAHKPAALERVLQSVRALNQRRLIAVFGCGGDRDRGKRPQMGAIAARLADGVIVTSDNPRSEDPQRIIDEIVAGIPADTPATLCIEPDRAAAIALAIHSAAGGDAIVIAGKGHETYQLLGGRRLHFDDREVARAALRTR
jgi:UDP-N-acetylmuramoyl-L-alanyl-D-glutamate--2,6-diaminopimelate ligase